MSLFTFLLNSPVLLQNAGELIEKLGTNNTAIEKLVDKGLQMGVDLAGRVLVAILVYTLGSWLIKRVKKLVKRIMMRRETDPSLQTFLYSLLSIVLTTLLIIIVVGILGIETASVIALLASAGVAIGLALSDTIKNFANGVIILLFKPYRVDDFIETNGTMGTVKAIQITSTVLTTPDNKVVIVPNGMILNNLIKNINIETTRRVDWIVSISYGNSYEQAREVLLRLIRQDERILTDPEPFVALNALGTSSVDIVVRAWTNTPEYWNVFFSMNEKIYSTLPAEGITFPFQQMEVHISK